VPASPNELVGRGSLRIALFGGNPTIGQLGHPVGHGRDRHVVRDDDGGAPHLAVDMSNCAEDDLAGGDVERPCRLVAEEDLWALGDGTTNSPATRSTPRKAPTSTSPMR